MPFFPREERDIISDSLQQMSDQTNITQLTPGGKARFFLATVAKEQSKQMATFDQNLLQPYIRYSSGKFLDFFGDMLNLPRVQASHAESGANNFMFYVQSGKFSDINAGSPFTIPSGTSVYTKPFEGEIVTPGLETQPTIMYSTIESVVCNPDQSYAYVEIRANVEGDESSVPRNVINKHNFGSYRFATNNLLSCTNKFAIDNGDNRESDEAYRYRLLNIFKARAQAVEAAIRIAALGVPGVSDVVLVNAEQGPGSFALYIKGITPTVSPSLIYSVSSAIQQVVAYGIRPFVSAPVSIGVELIAAVNWSPRATKEEIASGYTSMRNAVERTINDLDIGESLDLALLIDVMLASAPKANRIGRITPNTFEETYIYRQSPTNDGIVRNLAIGSIIEPLYNQRIILETSTRYRGIQFITF